jgi:biofilm protein TabA
MIFSEDLNRFKSMMPATWDFQDEILQFLMSAAHLNLGDYKIQNESITANIHEYNTIPQSHTIWENHLHTIDIQFVIDGAEYVMLTSSSSLKERDFYFLEKDREEFHQETEHFHKMLFNTNNVLVLFPGEVHRPMIQVSKSSIIKKAVIKLNINNL